MKRFIKYFLPVAIVVAFTAALYAHADSVGPNPPGTAIDDAAVGTQAWSNPTNALADDGIFASAVSVGSGSATTHYLDVTNFGFSIPSNATVQGIQVDIERKSSTASSVCGATNTACDNSIVIINSSGTLGSTNKATTTVWPTTEAFASYGGSADLWSAAWAPSDINSSNFGVAISAHTEGIGGPSCVVAGTMVLTTNGNVPIQDIKVGQKIWSYSTTTKQMEIDTVTAVASEPVIDDLDTIYVVSTSDKDIVQATASHMFYANGQWIAAPNLKVGDTMLNSALRKVKITNVKVEKKPGILVWNISVKKNQNFFANNELVHNASNETVFVDFARITITFTLPGVPIVLIQSHTVIRGGNVTFK